MLKIHTYQRVKKYLDEHKISQSAIAKKAGLSVVTLEAIMNGNQTMYADDLRAICYALNVRPEMFIEWIPKEKNNKMVKDESKIEVNV